MGGFLGRRAWTVVQLAIRECPYNRDILCDTSFHPRRSVLAGMAETDSEGYCMLSQVKNARCLSLLRHLFRVKTLTTIFARPQHCGSLACFLLKHEKLANRIWASIEIPLLSLGAKRSSPRDC
jgi:hypothetical protein